MKFYIVTALIGIALFVAFGSILEVERGYRAIGGEGLFLFMPLWAKMGAMVIRDWRDQR